MVCLSVGEGVPNLTRRNSDVKKKTETEKKREERRATPLHGGVVASTSDKDKTPVGIGDGELALHFDLESLLCASGGGCAIIQTNFLSQSTHTTPQWGGGIKNHGDRQWQAETSTPPPPARSSPQGTTGSLRLGTENPFISAGLHCTQHTTCLYLGQSARKKRGGPAAQTRASQARRFGATSLPTATGTATVLLCGQES